MAIYSTYQVTEILKISKELLFYYIYKRKILSKKIHYWKYKNDLRFSEIGVQYLISEMRAVQQRKSEPLKAGCLKVQFSDEYNLKKFYAKASAMEKPTAKLAREVLEAFHDKDITKLFYMMKELK